MFAGDSEDLTWEHITKNHSEKIKNIDILFAPHHGRDSNRNFELLKTLTGHTDRIWNLIELQDGR